MSRLAAVVALATIAAPAVARAQDAAAPPDSAAPAEKPKNAFRWTRFDLGGRVLVDGYQQTIDGVSSTDATADNARLELRWRPAKWLRGVVEVDGFEDRHLKDAYLAFRTGRFEARAGQFKPPISPVQMSSRWDLPVVDRGLLAEVLVGAFGIAGRRPGVQLEWNQPKGALVARGGVFLPSAVRGDRIGDEAFADFATDAVKATARLAYAPKRLELGTSFDLRPAEPMPGEGYRTFWTSAVDATWSAGRRGPRVWTEGYVGSSWQDDDPFDGEDATWLGGRVIAGWRFGGEKKAGLRLAVEPFVAGAVVDPDASVREDLLWEAAGGVHFGALGHLRLTLEAQRREGSRNTPLSLGVFPAGTRPDSTRTRLVAQLGAAF